MDSDNRYRSWVVDGISRSVPPDWIFPTGAVLNVFSYWHHGDSVKGIAPMKTFTRNDLSFFLNDERKKRYVKNFEDVKRLFTAIDKEAVKQGLLKSNQTRSSDTINIFMKCKYIWNISECTSKGCKRNFTKLSWATIIREQLRMRRRSKTTRMVHDDDQNEEEEEEEERAPECRQRRGSIMMTPPAAGGGYEQEDESTDSSNESNS